MRYYRQEKQVEMKLKSNRSCTEDSDHDCFGFGLVEAF
jgi:hypothetical protein